MADARDFLVELGGEELPPKALQALSQAFAQGLQQALDKAGLQYSAITAYNTPRRLAVYVQDLALAQADREIERRGPALQAAFDAQGAPTKALQGFARSCQVEVSGLIELQTDKGTWMGYRYTQAGEATKNLLPEMVAKAVDQLPVPKRMRWGASRVEFSRPVHWLVMLLGEEIVPAQVLGLQAGRHTRGHRVHSNTEIELTQASDYLATLYQAKVMVDPQARSERIRAQVLEQAAQYQGTAVIDEALLDEVNGLVEWPVALTGSFDPAFLQVPAECLISSMKANQKYFHMLDAQGQLLAHFITIANLESQDPQQVIHGNEKVIRPRLADAAFFFATDKKQPLDARIPALKNVVFQQQLGSLYAKTQRIKQLAAYIGQQLPADVTSIERAADLSKCDLVTEMVLEFPELQGIMGYHYALDAQEPLEVAQALNEQYMPRHAGDALPATTTGMALALADRLDTLVGIFALGQRPTGDKDPFGLRRASLGVLNILVHRQLDLDLQDLLTRAAAAHTQLPQAQDAVDAVLEYMLERFRAWYQAQSIGVEVVTAVRARGVTNPLDFDRRVQAVASFIQHPAAPALAAANKRVANILAKEAPAAEAQVNTELLTEAAEITLAQAIAAKRTEIAPLAAQADYQGILASLAELRAPVDAFFDQVMVMAEDAQVRANRLALLAALQALFLEVADLAVLPALA